MAASHPKRTWLIAPVVVLALGVARGDDDTASPDAHVKALLDPTAETRESARQWLVQHAEQSRSALVEAVRGKDAKLVVAAGPLLAWICTPWGTPKGEAYDMDTGLAKAIVDNATGIELVLVVAPRPDAASPGHAFYVGMSEVTVAQWKGVLGSAPKRCSLDPESPVTSVSWADIQPFLEATGFRLPTESEWSAACPAAESKPLEDMAVFGTEKPAAVCSRSRNALGCYDMIGNVWEWCADESPKGGGAGEDGHALRGGSFRSDAKSLTVDARRREKADFADLDAGFRVARDAGRTEGALEKAVRLVLARRFPAGLDLARSDPSKGEFWTNWNYDLQPAYFRTKRTAVHIRIKGDKVESLDVRIDINDNIDDPDDLSAAQWIPSPTQAAHEDQERLLRAMIERVMQPR